MSNEAAFVRQELVPERAAPIKTTGFVGFLRTRLFNSPTNTVLTVLSALLIWFTVVPTVRFLLIDAVWHGADRNTCLAKNAGHPVGACWPYVSAKFTQFIYGFYPGAERWRVNLTFLLAALLLLPLLIPRLPAKGLNACLFFIAFPVVAFFLLHGGGMIALAVSGAIVSILLFLLGGGTRTGWLALGASLAWFVGIGIVIGSMGDAGRLPIVDTRLWGGLLVTLVVSVTGIVASMPIGIALALGRRSTIPLIRIFSIAFIEFWRGVPLITVLFFATYMLPLFVPANFTIDGLMRALIGIAVFAGAYNAEVIRGGMLAIPRGQSEAASALGLSWWKTTGLIMMPQALRHVIPGLVNSFISLFKDTSLVSIVALFDLLGTVRASFADPAWATPTMLFTGFAFAGIIYFSFCFGMSRYSLFVERRLNAHRRS
ncbi:MAG: amino acid ABC transporter permease [Bradyrhizobium sp.]|uniref:amino acid ABC transporter permease n=1 Tax=Bradyrhizobium sp. TaxID=376 RepID=UPI001C28E8D8|nr:amino acid ABC transporter permease [Bradyrhizobium sp.]MBU6461794.1 amino acid ABC transporter permease [Pseudomonadota bacterium]MDE2066116.1 amino acid ABC transporter permease [Bradyrhizobium sp.]MDE2241004.1 amino acid ABC transporter permease [Bradyrhizobium sp.]